MARLGTTVPAALNPDSQRPQPKRKGRKKREAEKAHGVARSSGGAFNESWSSQAVGLEIAGLMAL